MLHSIRIQNFAIVETSQLQLDKGLTIITGETGAGKSILIDALGLVLGGRADSGSVRQDCHNAQIEATFYNTDITRAWLQNQNLDSASETVTISRVISKNGRSKALINKTSISVQALKNFGDLLVDIHGQHAHQSLLKSEIQRRTLDDLATDLTVLQAVQQAYFNWKQCQTELSKLGGNSQDREARLELLRYQVQELETLELTSNSIQKIEEEHQRLAHAQKLLENSQIVLNLLDGETDSTILSGFNQAVNLLVEAQQYDNRLDNVNNLLNEALIQAQEAGSELRHYIDHLELDPERLQLVEQFLIKLQDMARKHKVHYQDLSKHFDKLNAQLHELENYEQRAAELELEVQQAFVLYQQAAQILHQQREQTAQDLAAKITENMQQLGMSGGQLVISVNANLQATPSLYGMDNIEFLVSTNPGHAPKPLHKVVSGGELSRISLAIQMITAQHSGVPTLIFDEVDVGISGGVAEIVGNTLRDLGQQRQILCITHLPQVASQGHQHLQVKKTINSHSTHTQLHWLNRQQRIEELARMLGGIEITQQTLAHAEEMLLRATGAVV
ncbi:MAG: DNA repair protein RecN [Thiotrichaceae bacterium]|nr:DNA repair protein RecN [Thiotrichaceae bacterium]